MNHLLLSRIRPAKQRGLQSGLSLIELMIGMTLGLITLMAAVQLIAVQPLMTRNKTDAQELDDQVRFALYQLSSHIRQAGYGEMSSEKRFKNESPTSLDIDIPPLFACDSGFTAPTTGDFTCGTSTPNLAGLSLYRAYPDNEVFSAGLGRRVNCLGDQVLTNSRGINENIANFYVTGGELRCRPMYPTSSNLVSNTTTQPLLAGVLEFTALFGQDTADKQPDGVWDRTASAVSLVRSGQDTTREWRGVSWVDVCLVVRTERETTANIPVASYIGCDGTAKAVSDKRLYRTYRERVTLRNALS